MRSQFYILLNKEKEQGLFQLVREYCSLAILPTLISKETELLAKGKYLFVHESDRNNFYYEEQKNDEGQSIKIINPFDNQQDILPFIEYAFESHNEEVVARIWGPSSVVATGKHLQTAIKDIMKWAKENCRAKKKDGCIWIYYL